MRLTRLNCLLLVVLAGACGEPSSSSSSHWLSCKVDSDCDNLPVPATCSSDGYCVADGGRKLEQRVVFEDEFEGSGLDATSFAAETGFSIRNSSNEYYTDRTENVEVRGGELVLTARVEDYEQAGYTSASIETRGLKAWTYGRFEARILAPVGRGCAPSFWLLHEAPGAPVRVCADDGSCTEDHWPAWGDIVVMAVRSQAPEEVLHSTSYATLDPVLDELTHGQGGGSTTLDTSVGDGYHDFAIEWGPRRIDWFIDGEQRASFDTTAVAIHHPDGRNPFQEPFHIKLSLAIGGFAEPPVAEDYPQEMRVSWLHVTRYE